MCMHLLKQANVYLFSLKSGFALVYTRFHLCENFVSWSNLQVCLGYKITCLLLQNKILIQQSF